MDYKTYIEINEKVNKAVEFIRRGYTKEYILKKLGEKEKIFEIAKCRIKAKKKYGILANKLFFDEDGLRYSTPPIIANYRANRLKSNKIADVGCGVGVQLLYFALKSKEAVGIEKDAFRAKLARLNAIAMKIKNVEIIEGDALNIEVDADCIFSDPSRKEGRKTFESLSPNPFKIYKMYKEKVDKIAFELPPYIPKKEIKLIGEKEYTSLDFKLNRLALYTDELAECDVSAISLPSMERVTDLDDKIKLEKSNKLLNFLYEVDDTIIKAELLENLAGKISFNGKVLQLEKRRTLLTSSDEYETAFLKKYEIKCICNFEIYKINRILKKLNAKKATLRFSIEPKKYWEIRNKIEEGLKGDIHYYLFKLKDKAIIANKINKSDLY